MRDVECQGVGFTDDGVPAIVFNAELLDGVKDLDGKFKIAFGVAEFHGERRLVIMNGRATSENILASLSFEDSQEVVEALLDEERYICCINYDNADYEVPGGRVVPLLGRVIGQEYDVVQKQELPDAVIDSLLDIKELL